MQLTLQPQQVLKTTRRINFNLLLEEDGIVSPSRLSKPSSTNPRELELSGEVSLLDQSKSYAASESKNIKYQWSHSVHSQGVTLYLANTGLWAIGNPLSHLVPKTGKALLSTIKPLLIHFPLSSCQIISVSVANEQAVALNSEGIMFGWGINSHGMLGVKNNLQRNFELIRSPEPVENIENTRVRNCWVLNEATFAQNLQGKLYYWGK